MVNRILVERPVPRDGTERGKPASKRIRKALPRSVTVNLAESPLGWLRARKLVSERQFDAGEQLRRDWEYAGLMPNVGMRWDAAPVSGTRGARGYESGSGRLDARRRFDSAMAAIGPGLGDIAWRIICAGEGMRDAERALAWPARAGRLVLLLALDRLADHYRIGDGAVAAACE